MVLVHRDKGADSRASHKNRAMKNLELLLVRDGIIYMSQGGVGNKSFSSAMRDAIKDNLKVVLPVGFTGTVTPCFIWDPQSQEDSLQYLELKRKPR